MAGRRSQGSSFGAFIEWDATDTPTTGFDAYVYDEDDRDLLNARGVNITVAGAGTKLIDPDDVGDIAFTSKLRFVIDDAGDSKIVRIRFFFR